MAVLPTTVMSYTWSRVDALALVQRLEVLVDAAADHAPELRRPPHTSAPWSMREMTSSP